MLSQEAFHHPGNNLQHHHHPLPRINNSEVLAALKFNSFFPSSTSSPTKEAPSPLQSEGSTTTNVLTPPECSSNFAAPLSSIWSDYLNASCGDNIIIPFMADNTETLNPTSSAPLSSAVAPSWWSQQREPQQQQQSDIIPQQWNTYITPQPSMTEMEAGEWQLGSLTTAPEVNEQLSKMTIEAQNVYSSIGTALVDPEMGNNPSWSSILMGTGEATTLDNSGVDGLHEALFSKSFMLKKSEQMDNPTWEFASALKSSGSSYDLEELGMNPSSSKLHQFSLGSHDERTQARMDLDNWSMMNEPSSTRSYGLDVFGNAGPMDLHSQFDPSKIKQEYDPYNPNASNMIPMQHGLVGSSSVTDLLGVSKPLVDMNLLNTSAAAEGASSRWGSKLPAMLAQVLPPPSSAPNMSKQANLFGSSSSRPFGSYAPKQEHFKREQSSMSQHSSITSQHSYDSKDSHPTKHMMDESREVSSDPKRSLSMTASDHSPAEPFFKRPRIEQQSPSLPFKATAFVLQVRKEKLGERITALQQLVSPFGKTDTASVLLEAIGYIKFLHEQVQVLSAPYMKNTATGGAPSRPNVRAQAQLSQQEAAVKGGSSAPTSSPSSWEGGAKAASKDDDQPRQDLRSRGLCLVPISCTLQVSNNDNGADFWTPTIGGNSAK